MSSHHQIRFDALPKDIRKQLAASISDSSGIAYTDAASPLRFYFLKIFWVSLCGLLLFGVLNKHFGDPMQDSGWTGWSDMFWYAAFLFVILHAAVATKRRIGLSGKFGFTPGHYLFPALLIDARSDTLEIYDLQQMHKLDAQHDNANGKYQKTIFTFRFTDDPEQTLIIRNKKGAEEALRKFRELQAAARTAFDSRDAKTLLNLDPLALLRKNNWEMQNQTAGSAPSGKLAAFFRNEKIIAAILALALSPVLWLGRSVGSDMKMHEQAKKLHTEAAYLGYLQHGKFYVDEMKAELPRVVFDGVKHQGSVTALRQLARRFPDAGLQDDINQEIHVLYQKSLERFRNQAVQSDDALIAAMEKLLGLAEQSGDPRVAIAFTRPTSDALVRLDAALKERGSKLNGRTFIPAAGYFSDDSAAGREKRIVLGVQSAFKRIFPNDVLSFAPVGNSDDLPKLDIHYEIEPSKAVYSAEKDDRYFVGVIMRFQAALVVPEVPDHWQFDLEVEPPQEFHVEYKIAKGEDQNHAPEGQVYAVMAERAFDALASKINASFFRPDSEVNVKQINGNKPPNTAPAPQPGRKAIGI